MTTLLPGCVLAGAPSEKYFRALHFAEMYLRSPLPHPRTLRRWRQETPDQLAFSLRAPSSAIVSKHGPLRPDADLERGLEWTLIAADALRARAVLFATPASLTPGRRDRDLLAAFAERFPKNEERIWVWAPGGLWDAETAYPLANSLGLVCAFDPLQGSLPDGEVAYARLTGLGIRNHLSEPLLRDLLHKLTVAEFTTAFVSVDSERSFQQATLLQKLALE